ncbi:uncharacterized protein ASCRUDRAFT_6895 [Ascoidea rubescens DSM 1968]|uniref:Uncharacterized protein n=1 Tax=Ascoidea rubescens DSM 1968 TaxID=1344418 RepID=A0A1D2VL09_9ASCO|nr:hypothetical protein ASCRUDRAFT_6895 [Ascoidea rubescens DSM 1968]ODV62291.1 hypothetical protein ASCRUDRAFT_6895 [Ascoidea rubescens DSM 1968]
MDMDQTSVDDLRSLEYLINELSVHLMDARKQDDEVEKIARSLADDVNVNFDQFITNSFLEPYNNSPDNNIISTDSLLQKYENSNLAQIVEEDEEEEKKDSERDLSINGDKRKKNKMRDGDSNQNKDKDRNNEKDKDKNKEQEKEKEPDYDKEITRLQEDNLILQLRIQRNEFLSTKLINLLNQDKKILNTINSSARENFELRPKVNQELISIFAKKHSNLTERVAKLEEYNKNLDRNLLNNLGIDINNDNYDIFLKKILTIMDNDEKKISNIEKNNDELIEEIKDLFQKSSLYAK